MISKLVRQCSKNMIRSVNLCTSVRKTFICKKEQTREERIQFEKILIAEKVNLFFLLIIKPTTINNKGTNLAFCSRPNRKGFVNEDVQVPNKLDNNK